MTDEHSQLSDILSIILKNELKSIPPIGGDDLSANFKSIQPPVYLSKKVLKDYYSIFSELTLLFPTVFIPVKATTSKKSNFFTKVNLRLRGIPFSISIEKTLILNAYSFSLLALHLQLFQYLINLYPEFSKKEWFFSSFKGFYDFFIGEPNVLRKEIVLNSPLFLWLNLEIRPGFLYAELIDFIDHLYDQYKFTRIGPQSFRCIFQCFGKSTVDIGNRAFDYFIDTRVCLLAWEKSICMFLNEELFLTEEFSKIIVGALLKDVSA